MELELGEGNATMMRSLIPLYGMQFYPFFMFRLSALTKSGDTKVATTIETVEKP